MPTRMIATGIALLGFSLAIISGLLAGHPSLNLFKTSSGGLTITGASATLLRGLICMAGCYAVGLVIGMVAQRAIDDNVDAYKDANPLEDEVGGEATTEEEAAEVPEASEAAEAF